MKTTLKAKPKNVRAVRRTRVPNHKARVRE